MRKLWNACAEGMSEKGTETQPSVILLTTAPQNLKNNT